MMDHLIQQNPYRILGLLAGSSAATQSRQIRRLKQFVEAEQEPDEDYSFPTLGLLNRSTENIEHAISKLNSDAEKLEAAMFWFFQGNPITDDPAFDALKLNDESGAAEIWRNLVIDEDIDEIKLITKRNASAFHNLSTYYLTEYGIDEEALRFKLLFIESDFFKDFLNQVTDKTFSINQKEAQILFLNTIFITLGEDQYEFIETLDEIEYIAKSDFNKIAVKSPIEEIESELKQTKLKRQANKVNAISIGQVLHSTVKLKLDLVALLLGEHNITYRGLADKVADEILQCGIDYFNHYKDSEKDPSTESMKLFKLAKNLAIGNITLQRCEENTQNLQDWIDDSTERNAQNKAKLEFDSLIKIFKEYDDKTETIDNAKIFISKCKPLLSRIEEVLGSTEDLFIKLVERVSNQTLNAIIVEINARQDAFGKKMNTYDPNTKMVLNFEFGTLKYESGSSVIIEFQKKVSEAILVLQQIKHLNANEKFMRERFLPNYKAITQLNDELSEMWSSINRAPSAFNTTTTRNNNSGCYIATMAYGDYDHPKVLILRKFRDEKLSNSITGRLFIRLYYSVSPFLVKKLKNYDQVNNIIRSILNLLINKYIKLK